MVPGKTPTTLSYREPAGRSRRQPLNWRERWPRVRPWLVIGTISALLAVMFAMSPSTNMSREWARRRQCARNLRLIGSAIGTYCHDHSGLYPDTLATLAREVPDWSPAALICPDDDDGNTPAHGPTRAAVADAIAAGGHCSYVYLGGGMTKATATAGTVVLYEPVTPVTWHEGGCNLLTGDGHARWYDTGAAAAMVPPAATQPWVQPHTQRPVGVQIR